MNRFRLTLIMALCAAVLAACQGMQDGTSETAGGLTEAEAQSICSTLAVARNTPAYDQFDNVLAPNVVSHDPFSESAMTSLEQLKQFYLGTQSGFPDFSMRFDKIRVSGNTIVANWTASATHRGQWFGLAGTGKNVTVHGVGLYVVEEGKIVEQSLYFDLLGVARQLGARLHIPKAEGEA